MVEILLRRSEVDPNQPDNEGETPLWCAARNGYEGVVKILVARGDLDPHKSANGQTPLSCAADNGHLEVVKVLLERDEVDVNKVA